MATQIGTTLTIGAGTISGSYIVLGRDDGGKDVAFEDVDDQDGALVTRIVYKTHAKIKLDLICLSGAAPETDFAEGGIATHTDFTGYFVNSAVISRSKSAKRVTVELVNLGIT